MTTNRDAADFAPTMTPVPVAVSCLVLRRPWLAMFALPLIGCATSPGAPPEPAAASPLPGQATVWHSPLPAAAALPHEGRRDDLLRWWSSFDDPLLARLIDAAQSASPTLGSAAARLAEARAARVAAAAAQAPRLDAGASASRGRPDLSTPPVTTVGASLQASWELDVFGANSAAERAARARLQGAEAGWHQARVLVAAETAQTYLGLRACEAQLRLVEADAASRAETARLTGLAEKAGFQAPANAALARASAAQGLSQRESQRLACAQQTQALAALTGQDAGALRTQLAERQAQLPSPGVALGVDSVPARALAQRPDVAAAEQAWLAAAADATGARAQRWPRVTLAGNIGPAHASAAGFTVNGALWTLGPLQVSVPLFDGGRLAAAETAARARVDEAALAYRGRLRQALRDVEQALLTLDTAARREPAVRQAADDFAQALRGTDSRYRSGLASLFELEDARRSALAAQAAQLELQRERTGAWISLYQALGGGWSPGAATPPSADVSLAPAVPVASTPLPTTR